jgi:hypothetical protein
MRWTRLLLAVLAVILLVIGAGIAFLLTLDLNDYKRNIEQLVARETGRELVIEGRIDLDLGGNTGLTVTDVRFGNPDWAANENMVRIGRAYVVLKLSSLWSGPVIIELVELDNTELNLEKRESGENNWTFGDGGDGGGLMPLILRQGHVANFALTVATPVLEQPLQISIDRLDQVQDSDGLFDAKLRGTLNGRSVNLNGKYGPLENLLAATDLSVDVSGQFDTLSITVDGLIDDLVRPRQPRINIDIAGPDIDDVTQMLGLPDFGRGNLDLKLSLRPETDDVAISVIGIIGAHHIESTGNVSDLLEFERVSMQVSAHGPDMSQVAGLFSWSSVPAGPYQISGVIHRDGPQLILDEINLNIGAAKFRLDGQLSRFPQLNDAVLSLEIQGEDVGRFSRLFGLPGVVEGPFEVTGELAVAPGGTEIVRLDVVTQITEFTLTGTIGEELDLVGTRATVAGRGDDIRAVAAALSVPILVAGPFKYEGDIELGQNVVLLPGEVMFTFDTNELVATGTVGFEPLGSDTDLRVRIKGNDLAQVGLMAGVTEGAPSVGFEASGRFQAPPEGFRISGLQARIGTAKLAADGLVSRTGDLVGTQLKIDVTVPELSEFIADTETWRLPDGPLRLLGEFELLADALRLKGMQVKLGDATGMINADIGLPLAAANGTFDMRASGGSLQAALPDAGLWEPPDLPFEISAQGRLEKGLLYVEPMALQLGDARVTAKGVFDIPPDASRTSLTIAAQAANLAAIGTFNERPLPTADFSLEARFAGTSQSYSIEDLAIRTGDSDLSGSVVVHLDRKIPDVKLQLQSNLLDMTPLMDIESELVAATDGADADVGGKSTGDGRLIPDWKLPLAQLARLSAVVDVNIVKYRQNQRMIDDLVLNATLLDGKLDIEHASGKTTYGSVAASLQVVPMDESAMIRATFEGDNIILGTSKGRTREEINVEPKFNISVSLDGAGLMLREIAASLNGQIDVSSDGGRTPNSSLRFIYGDFLGELVTAMNPFAKTDPFTVISCAVLFADIKNGLLVADPGVAIQTDKMNIISNGRIDLHSEKLDINFKTAPRKKISLSAGEFINPYLKVAGTLSSPYLTLDSTNTLVVGGAAFATAGLSLLAKPIWDRIVSSSDPCGEIARQAEKNRQKKK